MKKESRFVKLERFADRISYDVCILKLWQEQTRRVEESRAEFWYRIRLIGLSAAFGALMGAAIAHAEPVYVCESPYIQYQLQHKALCPGQTERQIRREFVAYVEWALKREFKKYPRLGIQTLKAATKEAQKAIRCEWKETGVQQ